MVCCRCQFRGFYCSGEDKWATAAVGVQVVQHCGDSLVECSSLFVVFADVVACPIVWEEEAQDASRVVGELGKLARLHQATSNWTRKKVVKERSPHLRSPHVVTPSAREK